MTDRTPSGMNPSVHKPAIDEILQKQAKNYSFETTPFQSPTVTESSKLGRLFSLQICCVT